MSPVGWERQALNSIQSVLGHTDPKLASHLAGFSRLASSEELPAHERVRSPLRHPPYRHRSRRRRGKAPYRGRGLQAAETVIRSGMLKLGCGVLGELPSADRGHRGPAVPCGNGHEAVCVSYRDKVIDTVLGPVTLNRAWYHCTTCKHGLAPRDAELGVAGMSLSPGLTAMNDKAAAAGPFAGAASMLEDLAGVRLTVKRTERAAEASGAAHAAQVRDRSALIAGRKLVPMPPRPVPDMLYGVIDGTGVPMTARETAGRDGKGEDGRARTREVKLAVFFNQHTLDKDGYPVRDRASSSYIASFEPASVFADLVKAEGIRRGAEHVRQLTIIGDGAAWICYPDVGIADLIPVPRLSRGA